jgi:hypothetical protein
MRLYGGAVGVVSGAYSVWLSTAGMGMQRASSWLMVLVGLVALVHGLALFTPAARSIGRASGPLMLAYAVVMLLLQGWMAVMAPAGGMDGGMNGGMDGGMNGGMDGTMAMGADPGMVALALLMLFSGLLMTVRREMMT